MLLKYIFYLAIYCVICGLQGHICGKLQASEWLWLTTWILMTIFYGTIIIGEFK